MSVRRWKDMALVIHADAATGVDYTLCGVALEEDSTGNELVECTRGKINCRDCMAIIAHAKAIPARFVSQLRRQRSASEGK